ncbi:alpha/beta fold hydrolase [Aeromonas sobria]|jgi:predicted alpha/beta-hydrolase family hydrolase|uniref:Alpha/beta hydrolase n=1 Tax=Aeromonas sobria TaxID=646 RepID=A0A2N3J5P0_AERSO|nr:alpha/beta fold hydrolase [Aeromonas sobria]EKP0259596.1 alpha/beta fold hydrolase [Aeromonas sobria]PKQ79472.1 alpha/beta hydrolase [Aeromonas sobria]PKQ81718.1 alpha/beta hydrolase [Aeromonas sobria]TNI88228.1 alpha/beta hydrolase [Aeromonas sobria]HEH9400516.1 alpha/beta fold hydrolase [Aeromonas sobria]
MIDVLREGAVDAPVRILLAHGAGAGMDHAFLAELSRLLAGPEIEVVRFNFPYMTKRAQDGKRRPPDRQPLLLEHWRQMVREFAHPRLFLAGKSMGGRMAAELYHDGGDAMNAAGLLILGYPFHPPAKPDSWRGDVLKQIKVPTLLLQGERDTFGSRAELAEFPFSPNVSVHWLTDGDHGFKPRKVSGVSEQENMQYAADTIKHFVALRG